MIIQKLQEQLDQKRDELAEVKKNYEKVQVGNLPKATLMQDIAQASALSELLSKCMTKIEERSEGGFTYCCIDDNRLEQRQILKELKQILHESGYKCKCFDSRSMHIQWHSKGGIFSHLKNKISLELLGWF